jgi:hypothetical protein
MIPVPGKALLELTRHAVSIKERLFPPEYVMHNDREPYSEIDGLVTIARFRSAAEAGYFADELEAAEAVRPVLTISEDFDGIRGHWGAVFLLQVPPSDAKRLSQRLRELIAETGGIETEEEATDLPVELPARSGSWLPLALAFAAGSAVLFAVQKADRLAAAPARPARVPQELLDRLSEPSGAWVQMLPAGGRRELHIDARGLLLLREDRDGDGRFEHSFRYRLEPSDD